MHSTTVLGSWLASALNLRTEVAQVGVSMLGKMFSTLRLPARLARVTSERSLATRLNAGACWPGWGSWPSTWIGLPLRVTCAICAILLYGWVVYVPASWSRASAVRLTRSRPSGAGLLRGLRVGMEEYMLADRPDRHFADFLVALALVELQVVRVAGVQYHAL